MQKPVNPLCIWRHNTIIRGDSPRQVVRINLKNVFFKPIAVKERNPDLSLACISYNRKAVAEG